MKKLSILISIIFLTSCATIVNDANVPIALSFSDGSEGRCKLSNKRMQYDVQVPGTHMVRRSDDALRYDCNSKNGKKGFGSIPSTIEGGKLGASVIFWDLGITDSITDKHRIYPSSYVVPVK
tara:strand:+ start:176 stop:541 length:366 start_codon:yes stop_codon:yes gene_type:complete